MKIHYMDSLILLLALLGAVTVAVLEFSYSSNNYSSNESNNTDGITCWVPAQFTQSMADYTNNYCAGAFSAGDVYDAFSEEIPRSNDEMKKRKDKEGHKKLESMATEDLKDLLLGQVIVAILTFILLQVVITVLFIKSSDFATSDSSYNEDDPKGMSSMDNPNFSRKRKAKKEMSKSRLVTIVYCIVLLLAVIAWFILAAKSNDVFETRQETTAMEKCDNCTYNDVKDENSGVDTFLCDFKIRRLGNIQRYTVQCVVKPTVRASGIAVNDQRRVAAEINTAICFTIACLLLIHLLYTLVVAPFVNQFAVENGKMNFLSDLNLAMTVGAL